VEFLRKLRISQANANPSVRVQIPNVDPPEAIEPDEEVIATLLERAKTTEPPPPA
jgi:hypothetical protein